MHYVLASILFCFMCSTPPFHAASFPSALRNVGLYGVRLADFTKSLPGAQWLGRRMEAERLGDQILPLPNLAHG